jgi:6-phosphofructokinase 2
MKNAQSNSVAVLALNPAVDIGYEVAQLIADRKVQADKTAYHPGGNGINVALGLTRLAVPICCCSVVGGESGDLLLRLLGDSLGGNHKIFRVAGETRLNATLLQKHPPSQYEVASQGPEIPADVLHELDECFVADCETGYGVLTGSIPPGVPDTHYRQLTDRIQRQGGKAVVDAHGALLQQAIEAQPYLVRVNHYVLEMTTRQRLDDVEAVAGAARELQQRGIDKLCISLGARGAILLDDANSYHCTAPRVRVLSTVGCGDALLAGLLAADQRGEDLPNMLRLGVVCGSATAAHPGTLLFTTEEVTQSSYELELTPLDI